MNFETPQAKSQEQASEKSVEQQANFEGNWSEVLFDRIRNPIIREQLLNLLYQKAQADAEYYRPENFKFKFPDSKTGEKLYTHINNKGHGRLYTQKEIASLAIPKTKEDVTQEFDERLARVINKTPIRFSAIPPTESAIPIFFKNPFTGQPLTERQKSMTEAHEKGHTLRPFLSNFFEKYFAPGFDKSKIIFTNKDIESTRRIETLLDQEEPSNTDPKRKRPPRERTPEEIRRMSLAYISNGSEIAERMAQLKNYFNMRGNEQFTHEHLEYARKHYLKDIDFDNEMTQFFQAITTQTEPEFLRLINNSGI